MRNKHLISLLRYVAIIGNISFILWVSANAIKERFSGTIWEKLSYIGLMGLLIINSYLLLQDKKEKAQHS